MSYEAYQNTCDENLLPPFSKKKLFSLSFFKKSKCNWDLNLYKQ